MHEITDNLVEIGLLGGTRLTWEEPTSLPAPTQNSQLTQLEAAGLLTGALLGGVGIACAEFEFFAGAIDQGMIGYVECDHGPHHHRFDLRSPRVTFEARGLRACDEPGCGLLGEA